MTNTRPRWNAWRVLAVLAAFGLLAAACGDDDNGEDADAAPDPTLETGGTDDDDDEDAPDPQHGGSITVGLEAESNTWTPGPAQLANSGLVVAYSIYDPLVAITEGGEFEPFLAESIEANDDLTQWTLTLREGVQFHDGTALDAETLKWNFDTLHFSPDSQTYGSLVEAGVESMEVVDDLTVAYNLSEPNAAFPDLLRLEAGWPVSREAYESDPDGFGDSPVGTGPFVMQEWNRDDRAVVARNDNYWLEAPNGDELPYLDEITFRPLPDEDSRIQSLAAGDIDMMHTLRGSSVKQVLEMVDNGGFESSLYIGNNSGGAILNVLEPPVDDLRIRRALALASDSKAVQEVLGDDGLSEPSSGFFSEDSPWYSEEVTNASPAADGRDVEAAAALVEEYQNDPDRSDGKGVGDDVVVEFACPPDPSLIEVAQLNQALWGEAGFVVDLEQVEQATHIQNAIGTADQDPPYRGDYIINCWRQGGGTGDPLTSLQNFFGPPESTPSNFTNFTHPEIEEALDTLRTSADFETRYEAVEQIGLLTAEHLPALFASPTPTVVGYDDSIHGVEDWVMPSGAPGTGTPEGVFFFRQTYMAE